MFYWFCHWTVGNFLKIFYGLRVEGIDNFPKEGPVLLACNHRSNMDPVAVGCALQRPIHFMAKEELFNIPVLKWIIIQWKAFPVKRGGGDRKAIKIALDILQENGIVGLFPEGTRSKTGELGTAHPGIGLLAIKGNCPVVPVALLGTQKPWGPITIKIGKTLNFSKSQSQGEKLRAEIVSEKIMEEIAKLLDE